MARDSVAATMTLPVSMWSYTWFSSQVSGLGNASTKFPVEKRQRSQQDVQKLHRDTWFSRSSQWVYKVARASND